MAMGAGFLPRSMGVAAAVTAAAEGANELQQWQEMDEAKAKDLIRLLVEKKTALVPAFIQKAPGLPTGWSRFELQARRMFSDPALMAYYPQARALGLVANYVDPPNAIAGVKGFQNALRFHRMFVEAGGRVLIGTDGGNFSLPGLGVQHEIQVFGEDMKLPAMQIIQAATKWPAETMRVDKEIGTVEVAKLADLLIVDENPLMNIANLQKIAFVIAGKVQPRGFQPWYWNPFGGEGPITIPVVDDLDWTVMLRGQRGARGGAGGRGGGVGRPQPTIETIDSGRRDYPDPDFSKTVVKEGSPTIQIKVTGIGYFQRSVVYFNGVPVPTRFVNANELQAQVDESLLRAPGRFSIVVRNAGAADPQKLGDGSSNRGWLIVGYR